MLGDNFGNKKDRVFLDCARIIAHQFSDGFALVDFKYDRSPGWGNIFTFEVKEQVDEWIEKTYKKETNFKIEWESNLVLVTELAE